MRTISAWRVTAVMVTVLMAGTLLAPAASASVDQGYIGGGGPFNDDWGDEGLLGRDHFPFSNATGLWQTVLYADGLLSRSQIDCAFGKNTEDATKAWQQRHRNHGHGIDVDGIVGPQTFGHADNNLREVRFEDGSVVYRYNGSARDVDFLRRDGQYRIPDKYLDQTSGSHVAWYRSRLSTC